MVDKVEDGTVGERIATLRTNGKISQDELGAACSVSRQTISKWEKGKSHITFTEAVKICDFFKCDMSYLAGEHETLRRVNAEIQSEIGLSEEAINVLKEIKHFMPCLPPEQLEKGPIKKTLHDYVNAKKTEKHRDDFINQTSREEILTLFQALENKADMDVYLRDIAVQWDGDAPIDEIPLPAPAASTTALDKLPPNYLTATLSELLCSPDFFAAFLQSILDYKFSGHVVQATPVLDSIKGGLGQNQYDEYLLQAIERNISQMVKNLYRKNHYRKTGGTKWQTSNPDMTNPENSSLSPFESIEEKTNQDEI